MKRLLYLLYISFAVSIGDDSVLPKLDQEKLPIPYQRYTVKDVHDRTITFYVSRPPKDSEGKSLPVVLFVGGSGCQSAFTKRGEQIGGGLQNLFLKQVNGSARVVVVEKPGVKFCDMPPRPGSAQGGSEEFFREHTLERWSDANVAALKATWKLEGVDGSRTLAVGHSEGGIIAAAVAAKAPEVTHVASLAGGGPTQLFDLMEFRKKPLPDDKPGDAEARANAMLVEWKKIQADPDSTSKSWMGHPYRRWSTFLKSSTVAELKKSKARIYLAQGSDDTATHPKSYDIAITELKTQGRDVTGEYIIGGDHGFRLPDNPNGFTQVIDRVLHWFDPQITPPALDSKEPKSGADSKAK
jgi:dipeptidyl aminopeptidase/acylaminoacyl peptidase